MRVLGIDSAGPVLGVAWVSGEYTHCLEQRMPRGGDTFLLPAIATILEAHTIDLVAVSVGPGAFTGLRVGVSAALGVAFARGLKVVPVSSLMARAMLLGKANTLSLLDARKQRVYAQLFQADQRPPVSLGDPVDAPLDTVLPKPPFGAVGEGALVFRAAIEASGGQVPLDAGRSPAIEVARLGAMRMEHAVDPMNLTLSYLRPPDAVPPKSVGVAIGTPHPILEGVDHAGQRQ